MFRHRPVTGKGTEFFFVVGGLVRLALGAEFIVVYFITATFTVGLTIYQFYYPHVNITSQITPLNTSPTLIFPLENTLPITSPRSNMEVHADTAARSPQPFQPATTDRKKLSAPSHHATHVS